MEELCEFIEDMGLIDLPLTGRKYTWHRANGGCMSRLDRFLISDEWIVKWGEHTQWGLPRSVSDHCPILLKTNSINLGAKAFLFDELQAANARFRQIIPR